MEFMKETSAKGAFIPRASLVLSGFTENEEAKLHALPGIAVLTRRKMTASELCQTIDSLAELSTELIICLAKACKGCDDCGEDPEKCPLKGDEYIDVPPYLREEAGIPAGAKLCAEANAETGTITITKAEYGQDLRDISLGLLDLLKRNGICLSRLEKYLVSKEVIYR